LEAHQIPLKYLKAKQEIRKETMELLFHLHIRTKMIPSQNFFELKLDRHIKRK
jgi:hypothetical protein